MNEPVAPYVLTNENSSAFWLNDNLWMPLAGSFLTNGNFCFIEQVCETGIGGPPTHSHPSDQGCTSLKAIAHFMRAERRSRRDQAPWSPYPGWSNTASPWMFPARAS